MKWLLFSFYSVLLLAGTSYIVGRQSSYPPTGLVATRDLAANRLLQLGDISPTAAAGLYVANPVKAGAAFRAGDVSTFPSLQLSEGDLPLALPVKRKMLGAVNAGMDVRICRTGEALFPSVPVRTVLCDPDGAECIAIAVVASPKAEDITKAFGKGSLPFLEPILVDYPCKSAS